MRSRPLVATSPANVASTLYDLAGGEPRVQTLRARELRRLTSSPPRRNSNDEEKEVTIAKQATAKRVSAKQVAIEVLRTAGEPLKTKEIAKRVIDSGRCEGLKGKKPRALRLGESAPAAPLEAANRFVVIETAWRTLATGCHRCLRRP